MRGSRFSPAAGVLLLIALFCLVLLAAGSRGEYQRFVGVQVMVATLLGVSFRGLFRMGVFSLAGPGFMGIGAYAYALLQSQAGLPPWAAGLAALACGLAAACLLGPVVWRVEKIYLALLTLSLVVILTMVYRELKVTGGHGGLYGVAPPTPGGVETWAWFLACLAALGAVLAALAVLERSRLGRAWRALGVDQAFAQSVGMRTDAHRYGAFALFSSVATLAGIMLAANNGYVYPDAFGFERVVSMLLTVFVGGAASFAGPLVGALFVGWLQEFLSAYEQYTMMILGCALVVVTLLLPDGLVSLASVGRWALGGRRGRERGASAR